MPLPIEEIDELESSIMKELPNKMLEILLKLNRTGDLGKFLRLMDMQNLLVSSDRLETYKSGKILVMGATEVKKKDLLGVVNNLGLDKNRFVFCLEYSEVKGFEYSKLEYQPGNRVILCGPISHSCEGKEDSSSIITHMEQNADAYPRVVRLQSNNALKITKSNFREVLEGLIEEQYI